MSLVAVSHPYRLLAALAVGSLVTLAVSAAFDKPSVAASAAPAAAAPVAASPHAGSAPMGAGQAGSIDTLVERLRTRLQSEPNDVDGWVLLGRSYHFLQRWDDATAAFAKARALGWQGEAPALDGAHPATAGGAPDAVFQGVQDVVQRDAASLKARP
jgi:cytochrome c-type biogenesis protein CcmH